MSFAVDVKKQIILHETNKSECCKVAAAYGVACFGKYFDKRGIVLHTEQIAVAEHAQQTLLKIGVSGEVYAKNQKGDIYEFCVKEQEQVKKMFDIFKCTGSEISVRINSDNFSCANCTSAFVSSAFLCSGTMTDPSKGYNIEFLSPRHSLMQDFSALLVANGFSPKLVKRKGINVLYIKASEQIEDLLTFMGAAASALELMSQKVYKDIRNKANRVRNCESANIDKTVEANQAVLDAAKYLKANKTFELLDDSVKQAVNILEEMPHLTLRELAAQLDPPLSKSGVSHRLKKIIKTADQMQERLKDD